MTDDPTLLRRYATERAEDAFAELVRRHLPLVYSAAVRRLGGDTHRAEDVAQIVFCTVARDAQRLAQHAVLTGWLYTTTRNAAVDVIRSEQRRRTREKEADAMQETVSVLETAADWSGLRPVLDAAMDELSPDDRDAVLLRFFQARPFAEIGASLGLSEDAARKRVDRALDKLRGLLERRKIVSTTTALGALLASETAAAVPVGLAASVTSAAFASGGAAVGFAAFLSATKVSWGVAAIVGAAGVVGLVTQQHTITALREQTALTEQRVTGLTAENARLAATQTVATVEPSQRQADLAALDNPAVTAPRSAADATAPASRKAGLPPVMASNLGATNPAPANPARLAKYQRDLADFVRQRGLTPDQADRLFAILSDWDDVRKDFQDAIRVKGLVWTPEAQKLRNRLQQQIENEPLTALLGDDGRRAYFEFESGQFHRALVEPMTWQLAEAKLHVTEDERARLVALAKTHMRTIKPDPTSMGSEAVVEWEPVITAAAAFLSPAQIAVMRAASARGTPKK